MIMMLGAWLQTLGEEVRQAGAKWQRSAGEKEGVQRRGTRERRSGKGAGAALPVRDLQQDWLCVPHRAVSVECMCGKSYIDVHHMWSW